MKTRIIKALLTLIMSILFLGCGGNKSSFYGPDPEKYFMGCDISRTSINNDIISYDGFEIRSDNTEKLEELYKEYINVCEKDANWPINVYSSEIYWTHENKEGTKQLTANYDREQGLVEIFVKDIKN